MKDSEGASPEEKFWQGEKSEPKREEKLKDIIDPELLSLAAEPAKRRRHPLLMISVILIGAFLIYWLRVDMAYFFASPEPQELGDVMDLDLETVRSNTCVHITGYPNPTTVVRFSKRLSKGFFRLFPLVGGKKVYIQMHYAEEAGKNKKRSGSELPGEFTGRAIRFKTLEKTGITGSSYRNIRKFFFDKFLIDISEDAVLVMDGESPRSYWPYVLLSGVLAFFVILNLILFAFYVAGRVKQRRR
jgi:hypothetical protein